MSAAADGEPIVAGEVIDPTTGLLRQRIAMWQTADSPWVFFEWTLTKPGKAISVRVFPDDVSVAAITFKARPDDEFVRQECPVGNHGVHLETESLQVGFNIAVIVRTKPGQRVYAELTMEWLLDS